MNFFSKEDGMLKKFKMVKSLLFIGAGVGAGQKRTGSATLPVPDINKADCMWMFGSYAQTNKLQFE